MTKPRPARRLFIAEQQLTPRIRLTCSRRDRALGLRTRLYERSEACLETDGSDLRSYTWSMPMITLHKDTRARVPSRLCGDADFT